MRSFKAPLTLLSATAAAVESGSTALTLCLPNYRAYRYTAWVCVRGYGRVIIGELECVCVRVRVLAYAYVCHCTDYLF